MTDENLKLTALSPPRGNWTGQATRGTSNRNERGNTKQRAARRLWLLEVYASDVPGFVRCYRCGIRLTESTLTIDRIIPGCKGGKYQPGNIRPCCSPCNSLTGSTVRSVDEPEETGPEEEEPVDLLEELADLTAQLETAERMLDGDAWTEVVDLRAKLTDLETLYQAQREELAVMTKEAKRWKGKVKP